MRLQTLSDLLYKSLYYINILVALAIAGSFVFINRPTGELGEEIGPWALRLFWIVVIPGILKRFRVTGLLQQIQIVLMRSRRRLGILTFLLMLMHALWVRLFADIRVGFVDFFTTLERFELAGLMALILLAPLFITSNNYSKKLLKDNWKRVHSLIYVSIWFIALHVMLQRSDMNALITGTLGLLQIISWIYFLATKPQTITPPPTPPPAPPLNQNPV